MFKSVMEGNRMDEVEILKQNWGISILIINGRQDKLVNLSYIEA